MTGPMTSEELDEIEARCGRASPGPWRSMIEGRDHTSGSSFIMTGPPGARGEDIEPGRATDDDQDFIAHARQDVPRLVAEVRRLRSLARPERPEEGISREAEDGGADAGRSVRVEVDVPEYVPERGLRMEWEPGFEIDARVDGGTVVVRANAAGLTSLARHLLHLARPGVPAGSHVHLDETGALEAGSAELILEKG
jgi:hypothetical protein